MATMWLGVVTALCAPALSRGDVVTLKDGSTLKGRVLSLVNDTLTVRTTFGAEIRIERSKVELLSFGDSIAAPVTTGAVTPSMPAVTPAGAGRGGIAVTFLDRDLTSKIKAPARGDRDAFIAANAVEQLLIVDDVVAYSWRDTTMDKTIYNGPERVYKNDVKLEDFDVELPAGFHHAQLVIRSVGFDEFAGSFDSEPLDLVLNLDNVEVPAGKTVRVKVGVSRGRLRMSTPRLYRAE
jgi:hypothetical protein